MVAADVAAAAVAQDCGSSSTSRRASSGDSSKRGREESRTILRIFVGKYIARVTQPTCSIYFGQLLYVTVNSMFILNNLIR